MDDHTYIAKNVLRWSIVACTLIVLFWFVVFPPSEFEQITRQLQSLETVITKTKNQPTVAVHVIIKQMDAPAGLTDDFISNMLTTPSDIAYDLYINSNANLVLPREETWQFLEYNDFSYIKQRQSDPWEETEQPSGPINPLTHLLDYQVDHDKIRILVHENDLYYIALIALTDEFVDSVQVYYTFKVDPFTGDLAELSVIMYDQTTSQLECIQYAFFDWGKAYINQAIQEVIRDENLNKESYQ